MARNGSGSFSLTAGNPVTTGTSISSTWANSTLSDIASALTQSVSKDGQTTMTGNLPMGNNKVTGLASPVALTDAMNNTFLQEGTGAVDIAVHSKLKESVCVREFGAVGDGVTDDTAAIQLALNLGVVVSGVSGETYRTTSGLTATVQGAVLDLNGAEILADFTTGWVFSAGDGTTVTQDVGIRNGKIYTVDISTALNGVRWRKNVRRNVAYENLYIHSFKGVGAKFEEANWSIQGAFAPLIEACGVNLWLDDNANAISLAGCHLYDADTYNLVLRGVWATSIIGGVNQGAATAGIYIDNGLVGSLQASFQVTVTGVYLENNGVNHIVANNGRGLNVYGNFINGDLMTGAALKYVAWTSSDITGNSVSNMSSGSARDFVEADASSVLIDVGQQHVSSIADAAVCQYGGSHLGVIGARGTTTPTLPTASTLNRGSMLLYAPTAGTGVNRSRPYMCMDAGTGSRAFIRLATQQRKMAAAAVTTPYTPALASIETFDMTVPTGGLTINAPSGAYEDGDKITFLLKQNSTGGSAITWDAAYKTSYSNTGNTADKYASVEFIWSSGRSLWIQVSSMPWTA